MRWVHRFGESSFTEMSDLAKTLREKLAQTAVVAAPPVISDGVSEDGTRKWLLDMGNGNAVETVFIPEASGGTLCISTQAGCTLACEFCSTGKQGFNRNLTAAEIVGQLWMANRALGATHTREQGESKVRKVSAGAMTNASPAATPRGVRNAARAATARGITNAAPAAPRG